MKRWQAVLAWAGVTSSSVAWEHLEVGQYVCEALDGSVCKNLRHVPSDR